MGTVRYSSTASLAAFEQLAVHVAPIQKAAWLYFDSKPIPCFTTTLLKELDRFQAILRHHGGYLTYQNKPVKIEYSVITSHNPTFSVGGDLKYFMSCIKKKDRERLNMYAKACIDAIYFNHIGREFNITTISLVHGNALGGGFEAALSSHILIAERNASMGFPEVLFNLFPGMGAFNLLRRRVSLTLAEKMIMSGRLYSAEELYDIGIVDILADAGEGVFVVNEYIQNHAKKKRTMEAVRKVRHLVDPIHYQELLDIINIWTRAALDVSEKDIRTIFRLIKSQRRLSQKDSPFEHRQAIAS